MTATLSRPAAVGSNSAVGGFPVRLIGALLCLAVVYFHIKDQNGFPGEKGADSATWIQIGYYILEVVGVIAALLLLTRAVRTGWVLALGVGAGPLIGYILSRTTGLPSYTGDKNAWFGDPGHAFSQWVDTWSFVAEAVLIIVSLAALAVLGRRAATVVVTD